MISSELFAGIENEAEKEQKIREFITLINDEFLNYNAEEIQQKLNELKTDNISSEVLEKLTLNNLTLENGELIEVIDDQSLTNYYREFLSENIDYE
jgi:DNA-dependent RNA polymerase auxiliary subunit epsilon